MDLDPYSEYGSGSRKLLNMDRIRIRIHNIGCFSAFVQLKCIYLNGINCNKISKPVFFEE